MVLTRCSATRCLYLWKKSEGTTYMNNNRYGSDTKLRYAVIVPRRGACTCGLFNTGGAIMGMRLRSTRFRLHERKRIRGMVLTGNTRYGSDTKLRYAVIAPLRGVCTFGLFNTGGALMGMRLRSARFRLHERKRIRGMVLPRCSATRCLHFWKKIGGYNL